MHSDESSTPSDHSLQELQDLLQVLDLVLVGDERCLVDPVSANQQLIVQSQSEVGQTETVVQREVQSLKDNISDSSSCSQVECLKWTAAS